VSTAQALRRSFGILSKKGNPIEVHLIDGTYELFRHHFAIPSHLNAEGQECAATRGVLASLLGMFAEGATHLGVATDHVIESFRNELYGPYKTSAGVPPELLGQFGLLEEGLGAMGVAVWPMTDLEADDALASAAAVAADDPRVDRVLICTPDKDLGQSVRGTRVVQLDRRKRLIIDAAGVKAKFGVPPASVPDWLGLVGDSADGFPGLPGWGAKSAATVLARWGTIEAIPALPEAWGVDVRSSVKLAAALRDHRAEAALFKDLATLRIDRTLLRSVDDLRWEGPTPAFAQFCAWIEADELVGRATRLAAR
jgi:5'-3' exonuclease